MLNACTGAKIKIKEEEEKISMCEAIQQMIDDAVQKAQKEVKKERVSTLLSNVKSLMEKMG